MSDIRIKMAKDLRDMSDMVGDLHWMAAKAVEDLIKKDARIAELESELVLRREDHYRMDVELAAIKAQGVRFCNKCGYHGPMETHNRPGDGVVCDYMSRAYAAPVSEAKAQGVVMPELELQAAADEAFRAWEKAGDRIPDAMAYMAARDGFREGVAWQARLNAAPVQQVSVPDCFERYRLADKFCEQRLVTDAYVRGIVVDAFTSGYGFGSEAPAAPAPGGE